MKREAVSNGFPDMWLAHSLELEISLTIAAGKKAAVSHTPGPFGGEGKLR
jgi:hypothetical protein